MKKCYDKEIIRNEKYYVYQHEGKGRYFCQEFDQPAIAPIHSYATLEELAAHLYYEGYIPTKSVSDLAL